MKVGDEVVIGLVLENDAIAPLFHNTRNSPAHPCRGTVVKIGRKIIQVSTGTKGTWPTRIERKVGNFCAFEIEDAKTRYRNAFATNSAEIDGYVEAL